MASSGSIRMIDIAVNFTDGMFRGMYNGKQHHVADIAAMLSRAWSAGVDRVIQTLLPGSSMAAFGCGGSMAVTLSSVRQGSLFFTATDSGDDGGSSSFHCRQSQEQYSKWAPLKVQGIRNYCQHWLQ